MATPSSDACWRAIVLFGRNVASYKFALAEALLTLPPNGSDFVKLEDLATPFAHAVCRHLKANPKQGTSQSSQFLESCRKFNAGKLGVDELQAATVRLGFVNVVDAFHVVNQGEVPRRFFIDERTSNSGLRLTEEFRTLMSSSQSGSLPKEIEARWRLVETSWSIGLGRKLIEVDQTSTETMLVAAASSGRRVSVTSARHALNGYQKGLCFYCYRDLALGGDGLNAADVDHFLPHTLMTRGKARALDSVWNLVLACRECNRGSGGKFALLPTTVFLERLSRRNEYYISSHHPLGETIQMQTGDTTHGRNSFLKDAYQAALNVLIHTWEPKARGDCAL